MSEEIREAAQEEFVPYMSYQVRMAYQAGYAQLEPWPGGELTVHSGIGWFHPFGKSHYYCVAGDCPEKAAFPLEKYFTEDWLEVYDTNLFCIYRLADGDIYAYDGIFCIRGEGDEAIPEGTETVRRDILTNVIVGGTGRYEGARGLMMGTAEGSGEVRTVNEETGQTLPEGLLKCLEGYIKIPIKK